MPLKLPSPSGFFLQNAYICLSDIRSSIMFHVRSRIFIALKQCIIPILCAIVFFSDCDQPRHHYIYHVKAAIYTQKENQWIVKYLGPETIEVNSKKDVLSESNLSYVFFRLPGINTLSKTESDFSGEIDRTYYDFDFGILHIEYRDIVSDIQKQGQENLFVEGGYGVSFYTKPVHYDPTLVEYVITHAVQVN